MFTASLRKRLRLASPMLIVLVFGTWYKFRMRHAQHEIGTAISGLTVVGETTVSLGKLSASTNPQVEFVLNNNTGAEVDILAVHPSCGCIDTTIRAGDKLKLGRNIIHIEIDSRRLIAGSVQKSLVIELKGAHDTAIIHFGMQGWIASEAEKLIIFPESLDLGTVAAGTSQKRYIYIRSSKTTLDRIGGHLAISLGRSGSVMQIPVLPKRFQQGDAMEDVKALEIQIQIPVGMTTTRLTGELQLLLPDLGVDERVKVSAKTKEPEASEPR